MIERIKLFLRGLAQEWAPTQKMLSRVASLFLCILVLFSSVPFNVQAVSSTSNYWYNGVELPPLPSDVDGYFNFIVKYPTNGYYYCVTCPSSYIPLLQVDSSDRNRLSISDGTPFGLYILPSNSTTWNVGATTSSLPVSGYQFISSSHDVYFVDSDVVAYKQNFIVPYSQKDIYSYNDLIAPSVFNFSSSQETLDEHPYLYIFKNKSTLEYEFIASWTKISYRLHNSNGYYYYLNGASITSIYYPYYLGLLSDGVWSFTAKTGSVNLYVSDYDIIWSSVDVLDYTDDSIVIFEGSEAVLLGNLTSLYTVLPEDDVWEVKQGGTKRFELASGQNLPVETVTWQLKGDIVSGTSIDYNGLLTVSSNQPLGSIYVVASNINGQGYSSEAAVTVLPEQTPSTDWVIRSNYSGTFYAGNNYSFYLYNPSTSQSGASAVWSIYSPNTLSSGTTISSSGVLTVASDQGPAEITIQASSINGEDEYSTYTIFVFTSGTGGGGDTPTPTPTPGTQEVIDSIDEGFTGLGNKLDNLGDTLIGGLLEGLLRLFVPTSEELTDKMNEFAEWLNIHFPILAIPLEFVTYSYNLFFGVTPDLGLLDFPQISWMDNVLIEEQHLDLTQYEWLDTILPIIRTTLTAASCYAFAHWVIKKVKEVGSL